MLRINRATGVGFSLVDKQSTDTARRVRAEVATKHKLHYLQQELRQVEQSRRVAEIEAAMLRKQELLEQTRAQKELARQIVFELVESVVNEPVCDIRRHHLSDVRLSRAKRTAAANTAHGHLWPSQHTKLRKDAAAKTSRTAALEESEIPATVAAAVEEGGLQPAVIARLERAAREEHTKTVAARKQRRAAAARVGRLQRDERPERKVRERGRARRV